MRARAGRSSVAHAQSTAPRRLGHSSSRRVTPSISAGPASSSRMWVTSSRHHCAWRAAITSVVPVSERCSAPNWRIVSRSRKRRPNGPGLDDHHRPVDEVTERDRRRPRSRIQIQIRSATIAFGRDAIERAGEDRETPEHRLLRWRQQVVGPLDGRPQRPMPLDAGPPAAGQEPQTIVEPLHQIRR